MRIKFVYEDKELELTMGELASLIKALKNRNTRLYDRFLLFFDDITSEDISEVVKRLIRWVVNWFSK